MVKREEIEWIIYYLEFVKDNLDDDYLEDYEKGQLRVIDYVLNKLKVLVDNKQN